MRTKFLFIYIFLMLSLSFCAAFAGRSPKKIGKSVALLNAALIPPVLGNFIVTSSTVRMWALAGYYIYFVGMDIMMFALIRFTKEYCGASDRVKGIQYFAYALLIIDIVQLVLDPFFGHAFSTEAIIAYNIPYYRLVPYIGLVFHRLLHYSILGAIIVVFAVMTYRMPRVYKARFRVILITMIGAGTWQGFYIFLRIPVDRSMIGLAVFGLFVFYFALCYYPFRLIDRMLKNLASDISEALFVFDPNGNCVWVNKVGKTLTQTQDDDLENIKEKLFYLFGDIRSDSEKETIYKTVGSGAATRYYSISVFHMTDDDNRHMGMSYSIYDYTEEHLMMREKIYDATHDKLTGLYTKEHLFAQIHERLLADNETEYLIAFVDVKNFKIVNDIFGKSFGDYALKCVADLISDNVGAKSIYGRLTGDTFGFCIPRDDFDKDRFERLLSDFTVDDGTVEYDLLLHMGVYPVTDRNADVSVMFDRAHITLARVKEKYKLHVAVYDDDIRNKILHDQQISAQLNEAIRELQIRPYLQPIVDGSGKIVGAEALARWIHPENGFMPPAEFIPVFEDNGMIVEVDRHIWCCACETLARWEKEGLDLFISVNISPKDFYFTNVADEICGLVKKYGIGSSRLRIEITETVMMTNIEDKVKTLEELRSAGFIVEMDDFGSGYSSLNMLKDMPVDVLKIDMKFLEKPSDDSKARTIVKNIINLSDELGISSLTEGVETKEQYEMLSDMGCGLFQGYYFAKPVPVEDFERLVKK